jgi:hypothetical protein
MLAQAADPQAAARTRPFLVGLPRLREAFPSEQAESEAVLIGLLTAVIETGIQTGAMTSQDPGLDAQVIYRATVGVMEAHLLARTVPGRAEATHLADFGLRALRA